MRLDKFLKVSRIIKRRTVANQACDTEHVDVNGRRAKASYDVKVGDVIAVKENKKERVPFAELAASKENTMPKWLEFTNSTLTGKVLALPMREDIDLNIAEHLIVELYSK